MRLRSPWWRVCRQAAAVLGALWVAGCATPPVPPPSPTAADRFKAGETIELLRVPTVRERVAVVADAQGHAHVLVASTKLREVWHLVVDAQGVQARHLVRRDFSPDAVDAAFDREGRLHALTDADAWVLEDGEWRAEASPWQRAGLQATAPRFVPGTPDLVWAFHVDGRALGSPARVDWWGFGGHGAALFWPWPTTGKRAVIVARSGGSAAPWLAIEPDGKADTLHISAGSDHLGNLYVLYEKGSGGLSAGGAGSFHVLRIGPSPNEWVGGRHPVYYLRWTVAGGWAAPLQVGVADVDSFWGYVWRAVAIAAAGPDRAFMVWPTPEGISGRWVERLP